MAVSGLTSLPVLLILFYTAISPGQVTPVLYEDTIERNEGTIYKGTKERKCDLNFNTEKEHYLFNKTIATKRLILLSINLLWTDISANGLRNSDIIKTKTWYLATEEAGKSLLLLEEQFEVMSFGTLSVSIDKIVLTLKQSPENCLNERSEVQAMGILNLFLLKSSKDKKIQKESAIFDQTIKDFICNGTIGLKGSCCSLDEDGMLLCEQLEKNKWTKTVDNIIFLLTFIVFNQITRLFPKKLYMEEKKCSEKITLATPLKLNIEMKEIPRDRSSVVVKGITCFENAKPEIKSFQDRSIKTVIINDLHLYADERRFVSQDSMAATEFHNICQDLIQMFKDLFCRLSHEDLKGMRQCCFKFLSVLSKLCYFLLGVFPMLFRLLFLIRYDMDEFWVYFSLLFTNVCYLCFLICVIKKLKLSTRPLQKCMKKVMTINFHSELNNAVQQIHTMFIKSDRLISRTRRAKKSILKAWLQITLVVIPFSVIANLFKLMIFVLPLLHFILRVTHHLTSVFVYKLKLKLHSIIITKYGGNGLVCLFIVLFVVCIPLASFIFVVVYLYIDLTMFLIKCLLYMVLGLFQNFDELYVYISLPITLSTSVVQCLRKVNDKISQFNKNVVGSIESLLESKDRLIGTSFIKRDGLFFKTKQFLYFYKEGKNDRQKYLYLSKAFLNHLSSVPSHLTPGPRNWLYFKACIEIGVMFVPLCLPVVIVISYGNTTDLSTGLQFLVTLGGGALLTWFSNYLSKTWSPSLMANDELLKKIIQNNIPDGFEEIWEVIDFGELRADDTESNTDLYCVYSEDTKEKIQFFTSESFEHDEDQESEAMSACDFLCEVITLSKPNKYQMINENQDSNENLSSV